MSLAWGSIVILVMLLPGVLFFTGLHIPEKFTRDAVERSALGQLAGVLLVSLLVHPTVFLLWAGICSFRPSLPRIDITAFLLAMSPDMGVFRVELVDRLSNQAGWILIYLLTTAGFGMLLGWAVGARIVRGGLRFLTQHRWVYHLSIGDRLTTAWIMTNMQHNDKVLMYRGFLSAIHLKRDGTFSYIALTGVSKGYLTLDDKAPLASPGEHWRELGASTRAFEASSVTGNHRYQGSHFVIEGEDVANVVFDRYEIEFPVELKKMKPDKLDSAFRHAIKGWEPPPATAPDPSEPPGEQP